MEAIKALVLIKKIIDDNDENILIGSCDDISGPFEATEIRVEEIEKDGKMNKIIIIE